MSRRTRPPMNQRTSPQRKSPQRKGPQRNARKAPPPQAGVRMGRMAFIFSALFLLYGGLLVRAWYLQIHRHDHFTERADRQHRSQITLRARRGQIRDREGRVLANTADGYSIGAFRQDMGAGRDASAVTLAEILQLEPARLVRKLSRPHGFVWLKRHVTPAEVQAVRAAELPGVVVKVEPRRFYPKRALAGALLGFTNIDGLGADGVEKDFDRYLRGRAYTLDALRDARGRRLLTDGYLPVEKLRGLDVVLTLDSYIQQVAEEVLTEQVEAMGAKDGVVVVMDPTTGDVLAMAQTPAFDPNLYRQSDPKVRRNRAVTDVLEPGSTIKPFLVGAAMDAGAVRARTVLDGMKGRLKIGRKTVRDVHREDSFTALEVVQKSSNVGAVQIAQRLGKAPYHDYLRAFGFGESTSSGLKGERTGVLRDSRRWGLIHLATHAYGYGLSVTPLQLATAMGALANGGHLMRPRLVREVVNGAGEVVQAFPPHEVRRVLGARAVADIQRALVMVTEEGGTGRRARVPGFKVAGKTGTAHKAGQGGYSKKRVIASFAGFAPAQDPRLVIYVVIDEPTKAQYGGVVAAPVFSAIARRALPYLGVRATEPYTPEDEVAGEDVVPEGLDPQARPWWLIDPEIAGGSNHVLAPDLKGMPLKEALTAAAALGRPVEIEGAGLVVSQKPQAGALLAPSQTLQVTLALPGVRGATAGEGTQ